MIHNIILHDKRIYGGFVNVEFCVTCHWSDPGVIDTEYFSQRVIIDKIEMHCVSYTSDVSDDDRPDQYIDKQIPDWLKQRVYEVIDTQEVRERAVERCVEYWPQTS